MIDPTSITGRATNTPSTSMWLAEIRLRSLLFSLTLLVRKRRDGLQPLTAELIERRIHPFRSAPHCIDASLASDQERSDCAILARSTCPDDEWCRN